MESQERASADQSGSIRQTSLLDLGVIIASQRRMILGVVIGSILVAFVLLWMVIPRAYKSTASVMPPRQKGALGLMGAISRTASPLRALSLGATSEDLQQFQAILASRRCLEEVASTFRLQEVYGKANMEETVKELSGNVAVGLGKEDVCLEISVYDVERERAAALANRFVEVLDRIYTEMSVGEARANRLFLEERYHRSMEDLEKAENAFRSFQEKYGVYALPEQVKAAVQAAAALQTQIVMKETQIGILENSVTEENAQLQILQLELAQLRKQLQGMKKGDASMVRSGIFAPFDKTPEIGVEYLRRFRDVELQGKILELLLPLYEQAKVEEQKNTPAVVVLDTAVPAERPSRPKRMIIMILVAIGSVGISVFLAVVRDRMRKLQSTRSSEDQQKIDYVKNEIRLSRLLR